MMTQKNYFVKSKKAEENQEKIFEVIAKYGRFKKGRLENEFLSKKSGLSLAQARYALQKLEENKFVKLTYVSPKKDNLQRKITLLKSKFSHTSYNFLASPDKKKTKSTSINFKQDTWQRLNTYCSEYGCTISWFVNKAVEKFILESLEDKKTHI